MFFCVMIGFFFIGNVVFYLGLIFGVKGVVVEVFEIIDNVRYLLLFWVLIEFYKLFIVWFLIVFILL